MGETDFQGTFNREEMEINKIAIVRQSDRALVVKFFQEAVPYEDERTGMTLFKDVEMIEIKSSANSVIRKKAKDEDKERFPVHYRLFKEGNLEQIVGTPINNWAAITPAQAKTLKTLGIHTVEQLAETPDVRVDNFGPDGRKMYNKAKAYVSSSKDNGEVIKLANDNLEMKETLEFQSERIAELEKLLKSQPKPKAKKAKVEEVIEE